MLQAIIRSLFIALLLVLTHCSKEGEEVKETSVVQQNPTSTLALRGINWADPEGNAPDGVVLPSGLTASMTTNEAAMVGKRIAEAVKVSGGTTVRMPINFGTTSNAGFWPVYRAAINAIVDAGCYVILCYWCPTGGAVTNMTEWHSIWDTVHDAYKSNPKVLYEPINEPFAYSTSDLLNLYAGFLSRHNPSSWKCILDGTGYAGEVITVGSDSRFAKQYLGLHCYWWFWGGYTIWSDAYNKMASVVGSYATRTVVTEIGVETFRNFDFWWQWQTGAENDVAFLTGSLSYAKDKSMGTIAWSGVNDIDTYRWFVSNDNLVEVNPGCANMFRWSWGLPEKWTGPVENGTYKLQNRASGKMLDNLGVTANAASIYQNASGTGNNQKWQITSVNGYYWLYCLSGNLCLDNGGNTSEGSEMQQWWHGSSTNQQWTFVPAEAGYYKIVNRTTGKCLDNGGQTNDGTVVVQKDNDGSLNQQWVLIKQ
jgi:hypothetical protein